MLPITRRSAKIVAAAVVPASLLIAGATVAAAATNHPAGSAWHHHSSRLEVRQILNGKDLSHTFTPAGSSQSKSEPLTGPDDITLLGHDLFVGFQNGVGSQGEASTDGNLDSTIVEFTPSGHVVRQWDIKGKCDGLGADPERRLVIATVNEDNNSSIYTIAPREAPGDQVTHYNYNVSPLPHHGGTDAVLTYHGKVLLSASAPGTTGAAAPQPTYPAVYSVTFDRHDHVATVRPVFFDEAQATVANVGSTQGTVVKLALTDPDSNEAVPHSAARFAGDFMLTSQADMEQIFTSHRHGFGNQLSVLKLSQSVDDTAWATGRDGRLYATDSASDTVDVVTGRFHDGTVFEAVTPCDAGNAPSTCPAPGFPPNYLGTLNPWTGQITAVSLHGPNLQPKGMLFLNG
jgi:hypothetical protein